MDSRNEEEDSYPELFPEDFGERLERFTEITGLSWEEFAQLLGVELDRVMEWRNGVIPTGGEVWHIMRLAWSVPGGIEIMLPESAEGRLWMTLDPPPPRSSSSSPAPILCYPRVPP